MFSGKFFCATLWDDDSFLLLSCVAYFFVRAKFVWAVCFPSKTFAEIISICCNNGHTDLQMPEKVSATRPYLSKSTWYNSYHSVGWQKCAHYVNRCHNKLLVFRFIIWFSNELILKAFENLNIFGSATTRKTIQQNSITVQRSHVKIKYLLSKRFPNEEKATKTHTRTSNMLIIRNDTSEKQGRIDIRRKSNIHTDAHQTHSLVIV